MKRPYVSIDIETTGLDPSFCQVIEIGAVIDDWDAPVEELKRFHAYVYHDRIVGQPYALQMNAAILLKIANAEKAVRGVQPGDVADVTLDGDRFLRPKAVGRRFSQFLEKNGIVPGKAVLAAGKNFAGFDRPFLDLLPDFNVRFHHRVIDPAMLFWVPGVDDEPPATKTCMERAGIAGEVAHTAVEDAIGVIKMVRFAARESETAFTNDGKPMSAQEVARGLADHFLNRGQFASQRKP